MKEGVVHIKYQYVNIFHGDQTLEMLLFLDYNCIQHLRKFIKYIRLQVAIGSRDCSRDDLSFSISSQLAVI